MNVRLNGASLAHHVGGRPSVDDALLRWPILAHFRYAAPTAAAP